MFGSNCVLFYICTPQRNKVVVQLFNIKLLISRSRAAVARRAHNPKVAGSIPAFATGKVS